MLKCKCPAHTVQLNLNLCEDVTDSTADDGLQIITSIFHLSLLFVAAYIFEAVN